MIRVDIYETIDRPIADVFDQLADIPRYPEWMPKGGLFVGCWKESPGPVSRGTVYTDVTRLGRLHGEVRIFDRPNHLVFHYTFRLFGIPVMDGSPGWTLQPVGASATRIHHHAEGCLHGAFKVLQPLIQLMAQRERRRTVDALKASLASAPEH